MTEHESPSQDQKDLVTVFEISNPAILPVARSVLESADIPFLIQGEEAMGLFPVGHLNTAVNFFGQGLAASIQVHRERAEEARVLLQPLDDAPDSEPTAASPTRKL